MLPSVRLCFSKMKSFGVSKVAWHEPVNYKYGNMKLTFEINLTRVTSYYIKRLCVCVKRERDIYIEREREAYP